VCPGGPSSVPLHMLDLKHLQLDISRVGLWSARALLVHPSGSLWTMSSSLGCKCTGLIALMVAVESVNAQALVSATRHTWPVHSVSLQPRHASMRFGNDARRAWNLWDTSDCLTASHVHDEHALRGALARDRYTFGITLSDHEQCSAGVLPWEEQWELIHDAPSA
jgi:hypothetical protein